MSDELDDLTPELEALIPQAIETCDFDFAAYLLTLDKVRFVDLLPVEKRAKNPGAGYKFAFVIVGRTKQEFDALELSYANKDCRVEPIAYMQVRTTLRAVMTRRIGLLSSSRNKRH